MTVNSRCANPNHNFNLTIENSYFPNVMNMHPQHLELFYTQRGKQVNKTSKNFDKRPHHMLCHYLGLNDPFSLTNVISQKTQNVVQCCPFPLTDRDRHLIHDCWTHPESVPQTASQSVQPYLQGSRTWPETQIDRL